LDWSLLDIIRKAGFAGEGAATSYLLHGEAYAAAVAGRNTNTPFIDINYA